MMKKVVVIDASPYRAGTVSSMVRYAAESLPEGWERETFFVHDLHVKPCTGCMQCRSTRRCVLPDDDAHRVAEAILRSDALIVGTPCYWGNMTGELKVLFDRIVYAMMGEGGGMPQPLHKGKRAVLITACNTAWPWSALFGQTGGVMRSLREVLRWSGFRVAATLCRSGSRKRGALSEREIVKCKKLAKKIC